MMIDAEVLANAIKNEIPDIYDSISPSFSDFSDVNKPIFYCSRDPSFKIKIKSLFRISMRHKTICGLYVVTKIERTNGRLRLGTERIRLEEI